MRCPQCGKDNGPGTVLCPSCGKDLTLVSGAASLLGRSSPAPVAAPAGGGLFEKVRGRTRQVLGESSNSFVDQFLQDMFAEEVENAGPMSVAMVRMKKISYPLVHTGMAVIHELALSPTGGKPVGPVKLTLEVPGYSYAWDTTVPSVALKGHALSGIRLSFAADRLTRLNEADTGGQLNVKLFVQGGEVFSRSYSTEILARNQWAFPFPHASSCFVMPNDEALIPIFDAAKELLKKNTRSASFEGYQSGAERVDQIARALHDSLIDCGITYINPPASFEHLGQKVRLPRDILKARMGTCLDLAYLNCSMLERAGLNPVLFMVKGHAFYGYWRDDGLGIRDGATADLNLIQQAMDQGKLLAVNSTTFTEGRRFDEAVSNAQPFLRPDMFFWMVDIAAARALGIRPLPY